MEKSVDNQRRDMLLDLFSDKHYKPMRFKELCGLLDIKKADRPEFKLFLDKMVSESLIQVNESGRYEKTNGEAIIGQFMGTAKGFGFVRVEGLQDDIFIPENSCGSAMDKDMVSVRIFEDAAPGKRPEGVVLKITERAHKEIVGTYQHSKHFGFVLPDNQKLNQDIFIPEGKAKGAVTGHKVVVKITDFGGEGRKPEGRVSEILGHANDPSTDVISVIKAYGIPMDFPEDVKNALKRIPAEVTSKDIQGRKDIRDWQTVTIDGEDAKDLDDAITLTFEDDKYTLGVHIADVSHYVTENSPLDKEALKRSTSVYLVDRVIPMLPYQLSNGICSLNAGTDRLALSCIMEIDTKGNVLSHEIAETVIHVDRRMSYTEVRQILEDKDPEVMNACAPLIPMFERMERLAAALREKRRVRGGIDFDFPESKIILDAKGVPIDVHAYERNSATKIIEDFMLMANETIAEDFFWQELPFLYRTHETPDMERINKLMMIIQNFGYYMKAGRDEIHPKEVQKLLGKIEGTPEEAMISRLALRSMKQAKYTTENIGHFGLAVKYYCHFTSPIRRYPDLQIHRIIKENLRGKMSNSRQEHYYDLLPNVANLASQNERRADEAEREVEKIKKVEFMTGHIGDTYEGVISGITGWGIYVELPNTCEGMIRLQSLNDDYYVYNEEKMNLVGTDTGRTFNLGEKVEVCVTATDRMAKTIDLKLVSDMDWR